MFDYPILAIDAVQGVILSSISFWHSKHWVASLKKNTFIESVNILAWRYRKSSHIFINTLTCMKHIKIQITNAGFFSRIIGSYNWCLVRQYLSTARTKLHVLFKISYRITSSDPTYWWTLPSSKFMWNSWTLPFKWCHSSYSVTISSGFLFTYWQHCSVAHYHTHSSSTKIVSLSHFHPPTTSSSW